jgi:hypothetical protein
VVLVALGEQAVPVVPAQVEETTEEMTTRPQQQLQPPPPPLLQTMKVMTEPTTMVEMMVEMMEGEETTPTTVKGMTLKATTMVEMMVEMMEEEETTPTTVKGMTLKATMMMEGTKPLQLLQPLPQLLLQTMMRETMMMEAMMVLAALLAQLEEAAEVTMGGTMEAMMQEVMMVPVSLWCWTCTFVFVLHARVLFTSSNNNLSCFVSWYQRLKATCVRFCVCACLLVCVLVCVRVYVCNICH